MQVKTRIASLEKAKNAEYIVVRNCPICGKYYSGGIGKNCDEHLLVPDCEVKKGMKIDRHYNIVIVEYVNEGL
jgi:hypothetical protein